MWHPVDLAQPDHTPARAALDGTGACAVQLCPQAGATIGCDLLSWLRLLCLDGPLVTAEPKTLRYRLLHTAARIVRGERKKHKIRIPETWPWAPQLQACLRAALAHPTTNLT